MSRPSLTECDETLEVLIHVRLDQRGDIVCQFVDAAGDKILLRFNPVAARDLIDELNDVLPE